MTFNLAKRFRLVRDRHEIDEPCVEKRVLVRIEFCRILQDSDRVLIATVATERE